VLYFSEGCTQHRQIIDDLQMRHPNEFSFFLWHVVAGPHGSWDPNWEFVSGELKKVKYPVVVTGVFWN
jgi:hypothetical protein